ncbi:hypothetical protein PI125_g2043 [Phytophthora idaei]|nr:hypothetical protein PI125_g2043 [Phytophthora idaei]
MFKSDAENDDDDNWDDDVQSVEGTEELMPTPPEMHLADAMITAIGGMNDIASGSVPDEFLKDMGNNGWYELVTKTPHEYLMEPYEHRPSGSMQDDYPNLYSGKWGHTARAMEVASTPLGAFFYFMQPDMWETIATECNDYFTEKIDESVEGQHSMQVAREKKHPEFKKISRDQIRSGLIQAQAITARELCIFIDLLAAQSIVPNKEKLANHWRTTDEVAIPRGGFGQFMTRYRFMPLSRNLHFSSNGHARATTDRAWKLRPVIDALQHRFAAGYTPAAVMAFDEAMLPSRSTANRIHVYLKDKLHKWETKLFMLCCSTTAYGMR